MLQGIYWGSFLVFPFLLYLYWQWQKGRTRFSASFLLLSLLFIWARFIEPYWIQVHHYAIPLGLNQKIAVISDIHLGLYKGPEFLSRVVTRLNTLDIDLVLIAGDFTYEPQTPLTPLYQSLSRLRVPCFAVLGNHDTGHPGPPLRAELITALTNANVTVLQNAIQPQADFTLVGLGSFMAGEDEVSLVDDLGQKRPVIVLTHNPDSMTRMNTRHVDLVITGHTHGGQIRIPGVYRHVIPTQGAFDQGLMQYNHSRLFITSGLGTIGLPLRLMIPPSIDVLDLH